MLLPPPLMSSLFLFSLRWLCFFVVDTCGCGSTNRCSRCCGDDDGGFTKQVVFRMQVLNNTMTLCKRLRSYSFLFFHPPFFFLFSIYLSLPLLLLFLCLLQCPWMYVVSFLYTLSLTHTHTHTHTYTYIHTHTYIHKRKQSELILFYFIRFFPYLFSSLCIVCLHFFPSFPFPLNIYIY